MTVSPAPSDAALRNVDTHVSTSLGHNCNELDNIDLAAWADRAANVIEYHRGFLVEDRNPAKSRLSQAARLRVDRTSDIALAMEATGQVLLVQRRLGEGQFSYLAIKAACDRGPATPTAQRAGQ